MCTVMHLLRSACLSSESLAVHAVDMQALQVQSETNLLEYKQCLLNKCNIVTTLYFAIGTLKPAKYSAVVWEI